MAEFHANALSLVGNFSGPCIIYLNGEAITVKQGNGIEIAKWPYNCIRQFKAEDETGKFSFVSGRRGPYGVAEYNFGLDDVSELQHALSQFTGAQFSTAPISAYQHQQPLSSQQPPLPPLHPGVHHSSHPSHYVNSTSGSHHGQRPSSVSSVGRYSIGMGHRTDSVESVFTSPGHTRAAHAPSTPAPRLPPRDYIHNAPGGDSGMFISDVLNSSGGGYAYARARNSSSTGDLLDSSLSSRSCVPQPSAGGSPHVSSNGHYQHRQLPGSGGDNSPSPQTKAKADGSRARKSSPGTQRKSPLTQSGASADSESRDSLSNLPPRESLTRPKTNSTGSMPTPPPPSSSSTNKLTKQQTAPSLSQKPSVPPKPPVAPKPAASPKPSHPQQNKQQQPPPTTTSIPQNSQSPSSTPEQLSQEASVSEGGGSTSGTPEPQLSSRSAATSGTTSLIPDSTDLDHIPRSSPTVMRSNRPTLRGRQSPVGRLTKSLTTPALSSETYDVPKSLQTQLSADDGGGNIYNNVSLSSSGENPHEPENTYQVPRPTVDSEYRVPRPQDDILNEQRHYHHPKPADEVYKIPTSRPMSGTYSSLLGRTPDNLYSSPRPPPHAVGTRSPQGVYYSYPPDTDGTASTTSTADSATTQTSTGNGNTPDGQLYGNVTVGASNETGEAEENFYNVPRPGIERQKSLEKQHQVQSEEKDGVADGLYNIPRSLSDKRQGQAPEAEEGLYKVPRSSTGGSSDQEGLYKVPPRAVKQSGSESPPPKNPYEMIDFDEPRRLRPARSLESLHRVKTLPPRGKGNSYVGLNVDNPSGRPVPTGWIQKQPLPPRPTQQASSAAADNVYAEIPEDLLAKHRMAKANGRWSPPARGEKTFDNLYVSGPDVADSTQQPNRSLSPYDKLPPPRRPSPEVVASEGVAKAKELARQGYELCLPSGEDPRTSVVGGRTPPISMPPRNIPRKNFENFDIGMRTQRSMSSSVSGSVPKEGVLGTSIPSDSTTPNADEYVIITRSDTRLKYTQTLPKSTFTGQVQLESSASAVPLPEGDEYEQMNSVKSQILLRQSLHYSTPNPSLHHSNGGSGASTSVTTATTTQATVMSTGAESGVVGGGANHLYGNMEPTDKDFSDLDRVTRPAVPSSEPYFVRSKTLPPRRKTVSSSSVDSDVFVTTTSHNSQGPASIPEDQKTFVPVAIHDLGGSSELRLRSCSMDDILDNGAAKPKRHSYVNVPSDSSTTEPIANSSSSEQNKPPPPTTAAESAAIEPSSTQQGPPKKPKPFPRSSLLRVESEEQKEQ